MPAPAIAAGRERAAFRPGPAAAAGEADSTGRRSSAAGAPRGRRGPGGRAGAGEPIRQRAPGPGAAGGARSGGVRPLDRRRYAAAAERNRGPILAVLRRLVPEGARVLEVASGTGQHAAYFAARLPGTRWRPSDADPRLFASISAWAEEEGAANVQEPLRLDCAAARWPLGAFDAVYCANMIHIAPWACCLGLLRGAGRHLAAGGLLLLYGPFRIGGEHTSESNAAFDADLRARDPGWGVRDLDEVRARAAEQGLRCVERVPMPANNLVVVFERQESGD